MGDNEPQTPVSLPEDLSSLTDDQLTELRQQAVAEFDNFYADADGPDLSGLERATELADAIESIQAEQGQRQQQHTSGRDQMAQLRDRVQRVRDTDTAGDDDGDGDGDAGNVPPPVPESGPGAGAPAATPQGSTTPALEGVIEEPEPALLASETRSGTVPVPRGQQLARRGLNQHLRTMAARTELGRAGSRAPDPRVPSTRREEPVLVASAEIPGFSAGSRLPAMGDLASAMAARARTLPVGKAGRNASRFPVAYLDRKHTYTLSDKASPQEWNEVLTAATNPEVLVAAGGWCAPPTTSYDFFNIICEDGLLDLPTVGVPRGAMQWPVSPSFNDVLGAGDNPWTWTNQDDIDALTDAETRKPCQRVPCPELDDATLSCDGLCLTVGNLMDFAWPELVENEAALLMAAHTHYMNTRRIQALVSGSVAVTVPSLGPGVIAPLLSAMDLQAWDIRERFRMCSDDIIEAVLPRSVIGAVRADLALRQGIDPQEAFSVALNQLATWLDERNIRIQFVSDWQTGSAGQLGAATPATAWPTTLQFLMYPPGTWVLGQGLRLNLGVIRDSVLNASNDHTAAWMEDCYLVARIGHQSRVVTVDICPNGNTHAGTSPLECPGVES